MRTKLMSQVLKVLLSSLPFTALASSFIEVTCPTSLIERLQTRFPGSTLECQGSLKEKKFLVQAISEGANEQPVVIIKSTLSENSAKWSIEHNDDDLKKDITSYLNSAEFENSLVEILSYLKNLQLLVNHMWSIQKKYMFEITAVLNITILNGWYLLDQKVFSEHFLYHFEKESNKELNDFAKDLSISVEDLLDILNVDAKKKLVYAMVDSNYLWNVPDIAKSLNFTESEVVSILVERAQARS